MLVKFAIVLFLLGVIGTWWAIIKFVAKVYREWREQMSAPIDSVGAEVSRLYEDESYIPQYGRVVVSDHNAEFSTEDGRLLVFSLRPADYKALVVGDKGTLNTREGRFVSFECRMSSGETITIGDSDSDKIFRRLVGGK